MKIRKNIVGIDEANKIVFVQKADKLTQLQYRGYTIIEVGQLSFFLGEGVGVLVECSPPFGQGSYSTAAHCVDGGAIIYAKANGDKLWMKRVSVLKKLSMQPMDILCMLGISDCTNIYDYAEIDQGNQGPKPDLILSFGNASGNLVGFTQVPGKEGDYTGKTVRYLSYDYWIQDFVEKKTVINGQGIFYVYGPQNQIYKVKAFYSMSSTEVLAKPGYSGSNVYVVG
ncbi:MAG: hypothetical protein ACP5MH_07270 [Thermoproteus sp.]